VPGAYLSDDDYRLVTNLVPIVCIDVLPIKKDDAGIWHIGMIIRATGSQTGKITLIGGRVQHSELINDAILRHIKNDLGLDAFGYAEGLSESKPFMVQQYLHQDSVESEEYAFDPTKNSIGLTYLIEISESPTATNEASEFLWVSDIEGKKFGFNQQVVAKKALEYLSER
jgi:hypothetical protein